MGAEEEAPEIKVKYEIEKSLHPPANEVHNRQDRTGVCTVSVSVKYAPRIRVLIDCCASAGPSGTQSWSQVGRTRPE